MILWREWNILPRFHWLQQNAQNIDSSVVARLSVSFACLLAIKTIGFLNSILNLGVPFLFTTHPIPDPSPCSEQHDMKESLADFQEVDSSTVQCRVDQDELTPAITSEPRSDRHNRLNGSGNFVLLLCISIGGEGESTEIVNLGRYKYLLGSNEVKSYSCLLYFCVTFAV